MRVKKSSFCLRSLSAAAVWLATVCCASSAEPATNDVSAVSTNDSSPLKLRTVIAVDGQGVFLSDLVESGADLPRLRICDAPAFGKSLVLKRADVIALSSSVAADLVLTNWTGPQMARVSRKTRVLPEKELLQLLTSTLQQNNVRDLGQLELRLSRPWAAVSVPDEPFNLNITDIPSSGVAASFITRFEIETSSGEHFGSWQAALQAKVWREAWVAHSPIQRGESARNADLIRERRDMLTCREPLADLSSDDDSLEFIEPLPQGATVLARILRPRAVVHRGQSIAAVIQDGALMITLKVEALEDGAAGQFIRVRNPLSRRDLHAKVVDEQNVLVSL
jgi:flagellar basal body P-ring formation protein FlgA